MMDIEVEIGGQLDDLAGNGRGRTMDKYHVDIGGAAQQRIGIKHERAGEIRCDDAAVAEGALLGVLFRKSDQGVTCYTHKLFLFPLLKRLVP